MDPRFAPRTQAEIVPVGLSKRDVALPTCDTPAAPGSHEVVITSGSNGSNGLDGGHGSNGVSVGGNGSYGYSGAHGAHGGHSLPIQITMSVNQNGDTIDVNRTVAQDRLQPAAFHLGDPTTSIFLEANGGFGGHGGNGGDGGDGARGYSGANATRKLAGGSGGPGGHGGHGGDGGNGGNGGRGSDISVRVLPRDADLLMLLKVCWSFSF